MSNERGFALLAVMLVLALLAVVVTELAVSMRLEASMVRSYKDGIVATHLAEGAVQQAIREILGPGGVQALDEDGTLVFFLAPDGSGLPVKLPKLPRERVALGTGEFSYRIMDEESRINLNSAPPDRVDRLLAAIGVDKQARDIINDSLQDWKDADELHRLNGAESEDFYLKLPVPYRARNGALQDTAELLQIRGVTREIYTGAKGQPGLVDLVTVAGRGTVNINTAPGPVLKTLGLSDAEVGDITQTRTRQPYTTVPPRFAGRGLAVGSATFRIEAEGLTAGEPRARIVAIVQRRTGQPTGRAAPAIRVAILSWRPAER
ncbi:MAG: type II secretion system protein GspK [Candidatus Rokubacteria bacterium]|nr:type II secretion system protein GspK [Candidatus Rokubacteria bacterium]